MDSDEHIIGTLSVQGATWDCMYTIQIYVSYRAYLCNIEHLFAPACTAHHYTFLPGQASKIGVLQSMAATVSIHPGCLPWFLLSWIFQQDASFEILESLESRDLPSFSWPPLIMKQNTTGHEQVTVSISMQCWHICWPSFTGCLITWNLQGAQTLTSHGHWCRFCRSSFCFGTSSRDDEVAGEWLGKEWGNESQETRSIHLENHGLWRTKDLLRPNSLIASFPYQESACRVWRYLFLSGC